MKTQLYMKSRIILVKYIIWFVIWTLLLLYIWTNLVPDFFARDMSSSYERTWILIGILFCYLTLLYICIVSFFNDYFSMVLVSNKVWIYTFWFWFTTKTQILDLQDITSSQVRKSSFLQSYFSFWTITLQLQNDNSILVKNIFNPQKAVEHIQNNKILQEKKHNN